MLFKVVISLAILTGSQAATTIQRDTVVQASHITNGIAGNSHAARVALMQALNPSSTQDLCNACVNAEDDVIAKQGVQMAAQTALSAAQTELLTDTAAHDTCVSQETTAVSNEQTAKAQLQARMTAVQLEITGDDADGAVVALGTGITPLLTAWRDAKSARASKNSQCTTLLSDKDMRTNAVTSATSDVNAAAANVGAAQATATTACNAMRAGGFGAPTLAPTAAPTAALGWYDSASRCGYSSEAGICNNWNGPSCNACQACNGNCETANGRLCGALRVLPGMGAQPASTIPTAPAEFTSTTCETGWGGNIETLNFNANNYGIVAGNDRVFDVAWDLGSIRVVDGVETTSNEPYSVYTSADGETWQLEQSGLTSSKTLTPSVQTRFVRVYMANGGGGRGSSLAGWSTGVRGGFNLQLTGH